MFKKTLRWVRSSIDTAANAGDIAGIIPTTIILGAITASQPPSPNLASPNWQTMSICCGVLLAIVLWIRASQFANSANLRTVGHRALVTGIIYPGALLSLSYAIVSGLGTLAIILDYETRALPYLLVFAAAFPSSLSIHIYLRRLAAHLVQAANKSVPSRR